MLISHSPPRSRHAFGFGPCKSCWERGAPNAPRVRTPVRVNAILKLLRINREPESPLNHVPCPCVACRSSASCGGLVFRVPCPCSAVRSRPSLAVLMRRESCLCDACCARASRRVSCPCRCPCRCLCRSPCVAVSPRRVGGPAQARQRKHVLNRESHPRPCRGSRVDEGFSATVFTTFYHLVTTFYYLYTSFYHFSKIFFREGSYQFNPSFFGENMKAP